MAGKPGRFLTRSLSNCRMKSLFLAVALCFIMLACSPAPGKKKPTVFMKGVPVVTTKLPKFFPITYRELEIPINPKTLKIALRKLAFRKNSEDWKLLRDNDIELYTIASRDQVRFRKAIKKVEKKAFDKAYYFVIKKGSPAIALPFIAPESNSLGIPQIMISNPSYVEKFISIRMTFWRRNRGSSKPGKDLMPKFSLTLTLLPEEYLIVLPSKNAIVGIGGQLTKAPAGKFRLLSFFFEKPLAPRPEK